MTLLVSWLRHRAALLGLAWPDGVAAASGVALSTLASIDQTGSLLRAGRSARGFLARTLLVSVRDLEALAAGRTKWIADDLRVDLDRSAPSALRPASAQAPVAIACADELGTRIMGRVTARFTIEHTDGLDPNEGPRLPVRYAGAPDAFALALSATAPPHPAGTVLVFQAIPPGEIRDGALALLTRGVPDPGEVALWRVRREGEMGLRVATPTDLASAGALVQLADVLRAARVIGAHAAG